MHGYVSIIFVALKFLYFNFLIVVVVCEIFGENINKRKWTCTWELERSGFRSRVEVRLKQMT